MQTDQESFGLELDAWLSGYDPEVDPRSARRARPNYVIDAFRVANALREKPWPCKSILSATEDTLTGETVVGLCGMYRGYQFGIAFTPEQALGHLGFVDVLLDKMRAKISKIDAQAPSSSKPRDELDALREENDALRAKLAALSG